MGSLNPFSSPKMPAPDPELEKQRREAEQRQAMEQAENAARKKDMNDRRIRNQIGGKSLQDEEMGGFLGYRTMGNSK